MRIVFLKPAPPMWIHARQGAEAVAPVYSRRIEACHNSGRHNAWPSVLGCDFRTAFQGSLLVADDYTDRPHVVGVPRLSTAGFPFTRWDLRAQYGLAGARERIPPND